MSRFIFETVKKTIVGKGKTTLTTLVSIDEPVSMESEIVRVDSLGTKEISEITRLKIRSSGPEFLNAGMRESILFFFSDQQNSKDRPCM